MTNAVQILSKSLELDAQIIMSIFGMNVVKMFDKTRAFMRREGLFFRVLEAIFYTLHT